MLLDHRSASVPQSFFLLAGEHEPPAKLLFPLPTRHSGGSLYPPWQDVLKLLGRFVSSRSWPRKKSLFAMIFPYALFDQG